MIYLLYAGADVIDETIEKHLTIITDDPSNEYPNVNAVWERFGQVFGALFSLLSYEPVAKDYFYQGFREFMEDNNQYMEFRTVLPELCKDLDCPERTTQLESAQLMKEVSEQFLNDYPNDFCGIRMIFAPAR